MIADKIVPAVVRHSKLTRYDLGLALTDRLLAGVCADIHSWRDCGQWFGIDILLACVRIDIHSWRDCAQWFGIDRLLAGVRADIDC